MLQPDFSDYLNNICHGIKSRQKREDIMEELLGHLEDNFERNLAVGMSEVEAKEDAINKMGDGTTLAYRLSAIHTYSPLNAMSSAFFALVGGYICMNFFIKGIVNDILFLFGIAFMFSPLLRMRKMNSKTEKAFHCFNFSVLSRLMLYCISIGRMLPFWVEAVAFVIIFLTQGLFWFFIFTGLYEFCQPYLTEESKKPHLYFCGVYYMLLSFFNAFMLVLSEGEDVDIPAFILPFFIIFMYFFGTVQLIRMRNILWDADGEYGILPRDKKHIAVYSSVAAVIIGAVLVFNYASSTMEPVKTELIIHDVSESEQKEADKVRQKMLSWDVDLQIVEDLPDSEILKYKDAEFVTWGADGGSWGGSDYDSGKSSDIWYYWFFIPDKNYEGNYDVRLLCYIESHYADYVKNLFRKGFYYKPLYNSVFPLNLKDELNGSFISIVTEENGKKYNAEPFLTHNLTDENITTYPKGFEYHEEKGQRVYYATQIGVTNLDRTVSLYTVTVSKNYFFSFRNNNSADFMKTIFKEDAVIIPIDDFLPYYYRIHEVCTGDFNDDFDKSNQSIQYRGFHLSNK